MARKIKLFSEKFLDHWFDNPVNKILVLLLFTDLCFIILHIIHSSSGSLDSLNWSIAKDQGYAEMFQYTKVSWIVITLLLCWIKTRAFFYFSWMILFLYVLLDDSLEIHEGFGLDVAIYFNFQPAYGLRGVDFGEILVSLVSYSVIFVLLAISYYRSGTEQRRISNNLAFLFAALAFCGLVLDMVDILVLKFESSLLSLYSQIAEDGGEMVVISIILYYVLSLNPKREINNAPTMSIN